MIVVWTDEALADLAEILEYLEPRAPEVAVRLTERIPRAEQTILTLPKAGRFDPKTATYDRYIPNTRVILTYHIEEDFIEIIRAWHTSRDPETKPER